MTVLRIPTSLLWALAALVVLLLIVFVFVTLHKTSTAVSSSLPTSIQYTLEYFNAARQNSTLLVPSQYYTAARDYSINGNNVIENNSLYYYWTLYISLQSRFCQKFHYHRCWNFHRNPLYYPVFCTCKGKTAAGP